MSHTAGSEQGLAAAFAAHVRRTRGADGDAGRLTDDVL